MMQSTISRWENGSVVIRHPAILDLALTEAIGSRRRQWRRRKSRGYSRRGRFLGVSKATPVPKPWIEAILDRRDDPASWPADLVDEVIARDTPAMYASWFRQAGPVPEGEA